ncbi:ribosome maturation factor RimM [Alphaproteobacteria bacterium]|nr:ribosome maturation factor RimM [Alphaproteobacteria bacterium]
MVINSKDHIQVGRIGRPKGTKGLLRFKSFLHDDREINNFKIFYLENTETIQIKIVSFDSKGPLIKVNDHIERNKIEIFVNQFVYLEKFFFDKPVKEHEFYIYDLEGLEVINKKKEIVGIVSSVVNFGAGDLIEIFFHKSKKKEFFRFTKEEFPEVDIKSKKIFMSS